MNKYEVIIIGGGPAGATAGFLLAKSGKRVLIIDKDLFPRDKLCGGLITEKTIELLKSIYLDLNLDNLIDSRNRKFELHFVNKGKISEYESPDKQLYFVNRKEFDAELLNQAVSVGCKFMHGRVISIHDNEVVLSSNETLCAELIIGADGANSVVRNEVNQNVLSKDLTYALEIDVDYVDVNCFKHGMCPQIYFGYIEGGYGWVFPKKNKVTIGLGGPIKKNGNQFQKLFSNFAKNIVNKNLSDYLKSVKGFPVPMHNLSRAQSKNNTLLIGDAAGLVEPITGEGIYYAIKSGKIAAETILNSKNICIDYNLSFFNEFYKKFRVINLFKSIFFNKFLHGYWLKKINKERKYAGRFFELLCGELEYVQFAKEIIFPSKNIAKN